MAASDTPDARPVTDSGKTTSAPPSASEDTQLSAPDRVSTEVSSIALDPGLIDRGLLGGRLPAAGSSNAGSSSLGLSNGGLLNFAGKPSAANSTASTEAAAADVEAMLRVKTGDESAFSFLVQKYRRPMVGYMYRLCHNPSTAEELAQEVFLRVYRSRTSYEPSAKFTTWLYRIATNLAVNHARDTRHERAQNTVRLDEPDQETGTTPDLPDESLSAEEAILKRERLAAIRSKVNALPERQRMAVMMHKYQQMDYREIATVLKLSESATKSLLFRAYETLREQLKEFVSGK
jgi:RNA polymerase sigma-70 factor, ECF subfamily